MIPTTDTPPLHPIGPAQFQSKSTLVVTVTSTGECYTDVRSATQTLERGEMTDLPPVLSFESSDELTRTLTSQVRDRIEAIRRDEPESIIKVCASSIGR